MAHEMLDDDEECELHEDSLAMMDQGVAAMVRLARKNTSRTSQFTDVQALQEMLASERAAHRQTRDQLRALTDFVETIGLSEAWTTYSFADTEQERNQLVADLTKTLKST